MAINIGNEATQAIVDLRGNTAFERFVDALGQVAQTRQYAAARANPEQRVDQTSHANGVFDVWDAVYMAYRGLNPGQGKKPPQQRLRDSEHGQAA